MIKNLLVRYKVEQQLVQHHGWAQKVAHVHAKKTVSLVDLKGLTVQSSVRTVLLNQFNKVVL